MLITSLSPWAMTNFVPKSGCEMYGMSVPFPCLPGMKMSLGNQGFIKLAGENGRHVYLFDRSLMASIR